MALIYQVIRTTDSQIPATVVSRHRTRDAAQAKIDSANRRLKATPGYRNNYHPWRIRIAVPTVPAKYRSAACYDYWEMDNNREWVWGGMSGGFRHLYDLYVISNHRGQQPDDFYWRITARKLATDEPNVDAVVAES